MHVRYGFGEDFQTTFPLVPLIIFFCQALWFQLYFVSLSVGKVYLILSNNSSHDGIRISFILSSLNERNINVFYFFCSIASPHTYPPNSDLLPMADEIDSISRIITDRNWCRLSFAHISRIAVWVLFLCINPASASQVHNWFPISIIAPDLFALG